MRGGRPSANALCARFTIRGVRLLGVGSFTLYHLSMEFTNHATNTRELLQPLPGGCVVLPHLASFYPVFPGEKSFLLHLVQGWI